MSTIKLVQFQVVLGRRIRTAEGKLAQPPFVSTRKPLVLVRGSNRIAHGTIALGREESFIAHDLSEHLRSCLANI